MFFDVWFSSLNFFWADLKTWIESTFEEYINVNSAAKVGHSSEVKFPFNFKGMKDFVPIVSDTNFVGQIRKRILNA